MATKSVTSVVQSTSLEQNLGRTIMGEYISNIDKIILDLFQGTGYNVCVPTLEYLADTLPGLKEKLVTVYNMNMGLQEGVQNIPDELKVSQGALFDGLCFGYDTRDDSYELYTLNFSLLNLMGNTGANMSKQCIEKNLKGEVKGYRIDVEYIVSSDSFSCKPVNHRKPIDDSDNGVKLVPYIVIARMMKILETMISGGSVLKTVQEVGDLQKIRCVTRNVNVLEKFCDSKLAVQDLSCSYFPLKAFFYVPVLGAPSTTSMVTNINLFRLCEIRVLKSISQVKALGVEKPKNPIEDVIIEGVIVSKLMTLKGTNGIMLMNLINNFPKSQDILGGLESAEQVSSTTLSKYLHSLKRKEMAEVAKMIPDCMSDIKRIIGVFRAEPIGVHPEEFDKLRDLLKKHICKFTIRKKDCSLSSIIGTNSREMLEVIYGKDYFKKYEGFGVRLDATLHEYKKVGLANALENNGLFANVNQVKEIETILGSGIDIFGDKARKEIADILGEKTSARSQGNGIMLRTLNAYISEKDMGGGNFKNVVNDFYRVVDTNKIVSAMIIA